MSDPAAFGRSLNRAIKRSWSLSFTGEHETRQLAQDIAGIIRPGDVIALSGDLGAGKSTFARALIRQLANDPSLEAPSPTFTLMQAYATPRGEVLHADLYRLHSGAELAELGLVEAMDGAISLIEWPDRGGDVINADRRLDIVFALNPAGGDEERTVTLLPGASWADRLGLTLGARKLIDSAGWGEATRVHMLGDASSRAYERLVRPNGETAILMMSPARADGPPIRAGKPYSAIARLAERVDAFVAMDRGLRALDLSAPEIIASDLANGLLLTEDLGSGSVLEDGRPVAERYDVAAEVLAAIHARALPTILPVADGREHLVPDYDLEALSIETELVLDWYVPHIAGVALAQVARAEFARHWTPLFETLLAGQRTWVLRDYHSPNLIWLPERSGLRRMGLIDFQDAVMGHPAYDVVSLGQDARVDIDPALEMRVLSRYAAARRAQDLDFDLATFATAYAIMGAQRNTKILGIFARLDKRDGKAAYLRHLPRIEGYLRRDLAHPALAGLKGWYETHLPRLFDRS
ncbi:MAG: tRNA (adenosine(37)-N6)-threonylcarbamoyltransferase complex ATPase subunit type 1 TsaE [Hyphomicrobiales bacterium]|nr:tRNA (adenosine(37)-N6)-threonylcarbamoyltransferase complex ATPase subunit type 1 TsaE [Hyphomicrobiales bacterium]